MGNLHVWFLRPDLTHYKEPFEGNRFVDTADLFAQFDYDKEAIFDHFLPLTREGSKRTARESLSRGWPVQGWLLDDYLQVVEDNEAYHSTH